MIQRKAILKKNCADDCNHYNEDDITEDFKIQIKLLKEILNVK